MGEAHKFVLFPNGCSMKQMTNLLGLYGGCDTDELKRIRKLPSRWVALCTTFPSLVLYEGGCYLLHSDSPDERKAPSKLAVALAGAKRPRQAVGGAGGHDREEDGREDGGDEDAGY